MAPVATTPTPTTTSTPTPTPPPINSIKSLAQSSSSSDEIHHSKSTMSTRSRSAFPRPPVFASKLQERAYLKFRLAQAFRIFGRLGYDEGVAGHITVRDPIETDAFWVNPFGLHFSLITPSSLLLVSHTGTILDIDIDTSSPTPTPTRTTTTPRLLNTAAFAIHSAIHTARPSSVLCAAHSHSIYGRAYSTLGKELDMITQDSCAFWKDHAVYRRFNGVVLAEEEGRNIAECLGDKKAVILQNHGLLVATSSIEATVHYFIALEKSCHVQLLADAAAGPNGTVKIGEVEAEETYKTVGTAYGGWFSGLPQFQILENSEGVKWEDVEGKEEGSVDIRIRVGDAK